MRILDRATRRRRRSRGGRVGVFSQGIARIPHLKTLLDATEIVVDPSHLAALTLSYVVGWGERPTTRRARKYAALHRLPFVRLEDGFVRSTALGASGAPTNSVVFDDLGIYYDARRPSRLEAWLADPAFSVDAAKTARASACMATIRTHQISKYNLTTGQLELDEPREARARVLVVDQTAGDLSLELGLTPVGAFDAMIAAARDEHPGAALFVKSHPDVLAGAKRGCIELSRLPERVTLVAADVNPIALVSEMDHVYVATSQLGFEALVAGAQVTCFGAPFYSGWGLTRDRMRVDRRKVTRSLEEVFATAYFDYARYIHPVTGKRCELEDLMDAIVQERGRDLAPADGQY